MDEKNQDDKSHEYMRRKLWCDVLVAAMKCKGYDDPVRAAGAALTNFDERFGKGDGE